MRIVFEGADLTGKSTLAKLLYETSEGFTYRGKITRVGPENVKEANIADLMPDNQIMDRCYWMSDLVYETLKDKESVFNNPADIVQLAGAPIICYIICICEDEEEHRRRYEERSDELWSFEEIRRAQKEYIKLIREIEPFDNILVLDTSYNSVVHSMAQITSWFRRRG